MSEQASPTYFRPLKQSVLSLRGGHLSVEWSSPIDADELTDALEWIDLVKRQISREGKSL